MASIAIVNEEHSAPLTFVRLPEDPRQLRSHLDYFCGRAVKDHDDAVGRANDLLELLDHVPRISMAIPFKALLDCVASIGGGSSSSSVTDSERGQTLWESSQIRPILAVIVIKTKSNVPAAVMTPRDWASGVSKHDRARIEIEWDSSRCILVAVNREHGWRPVLTQAWLLHALTGLPEKDCARIACQGGLVSGNTSGPVHCFLRGAFEARQYAKDSEQFRRWVSLPATNRKTFAGANHLQVDEDSAKLYIPSDVLAKQPNAAHRPAMLHSLAAGSSIVDIDLSAFYPSMMSILALCPTSVAVHNAHRIWQTASTDAIAKTALERLASTWIAQFCAKSKRKALETVLERPCSGAMFLLTLLRFCLKRLQSEGRLHAPARILADLIKAITNSAYGFMAAHRSPETQSHYLSCMVISALTTAGARHVQSALLQEIGTRMPKSKVLMSINDGFRVLVAAEDSAAFDAWRREVPKRFHGLLRFGDDPPRYTAALVRNTTHFAALDHLSDSRLFVRGFESRHASCCFRIQLAFDTALRCILKGEGWQEIAAKLADLVDYASVEPVWKVQTRCFLSRGNVFGVEVDAKHAIATHVAVAPGKRRSLAAPFAGWLVAGDTPATPVRLILDDGNTEPVPDRNVWYKLCVGRMLVQPLAQRVLSAVFVGFDRRKFVSIVVKRDADVLACVEEGMRRIPTPRKPKNAEIASLQPASVLGDDPDGALQVVRYGTSKCGQCGQPSWWTVDVAHLNAQGVASRSAFECNHCGLDVRGRQTTQESASDIRLEIHGDANHQAARLTAILTPLSILLARCPQTRQLSNVTTEPTRDLLQGCHLWTQAVARLLWNEYTKEAVQ